mgnify:CR=1 FL=1
MVFSFLFFQPVSCLKYGFKAVSYIKLFAQSLYVKIESPRLDRVLTSPYFFIYFFSEKCDIFIAHQKLKQLTFKDIAIDTKNQNVSKAGKHIELTPKEFELLEV